MRFGVDYYPEHWPRERWDTDARLMVDMGIEVARMGEFSWAQLEPRPGVYDFAWLDEAIALLGSHGIRTVLGTPTAAPPAWMIKRHPEILPVDAQGRRMAFGGRHHDCQSNVLYRQYVTGLVTAMAAHYAGNHHVVGWQIDNELGNSHGELCMCDACEAAFQAWLTQRYGSVAALNQAWGTAFWSQHYDDFGQIPAPRLTATAHSPSLLLDWRRFCSDLIVDFQKVQVDILRSRCPRQFITHNCMGFADKVDYFDLARDLDFVAQDQYPMEYQDAAQPYRTPVTLAATLDLMRGIKAKPFWIMEQQAGPAGWACFGNTPRPGQLALWTAQAIAHGADTVVYFRWRSCDAGTEQYWHGILPHSGVPGRRYGELKEAMVLLRPVMEQVQGGMTGADTALVYDYDQYWALQIQPHHPELSYPRQVQTYYAGLYRRNCMVDFVPETAALDGYKLVIAPLLYLMTPELEERLFSYVAQGGHLVLTMRTGVKDAGNRCMTASPLPGRLGALAGLEIDEYDCLRTGGSRFAWATGEAGFGNIWCDVITPMGCRTLASWQAGYAQGHPAITVHNYGKGRVYYVGTELDADAQDHLTGLLVREAGLGPIGDAPAGVELCRRQTAEADYIFAMNHHGEPLAVDLPPAWEPLLGGGDEMPPYAFWVLRSERKEAR